MSYESRVSDAAAAVILPPLPFLSCCPVTVRVKDTGSKQVKSAFKMQPLTIYLLKVITHMFQTRACSDLVVSFSIDVNYIISLLTC